MLLSATLLLSLAFSRFLITPNRYSTLLSSSLSMVSGLGEGDQGKRVYTPLFVALFFSFFRLNILGNIPGFLTPRMIYFFSASIRILLWLALMVVVFNTQLKSFVSHILPFGSPMALSLLLPLIELFSHLIRPLTLIIRLSTNLSSGHIILYIFSFFSVSSTLLTLSLSLVLGLLFLLEIGISALQAYIFTSLSLMYIRETV